MAFKDRLREARKKLGLTQTEIAEKIGVAKSTYAGYETGNSEPNIHLTSLIMDCLKVDANFLWQDSIKKELQEDSYEEYEKYEDPHVLERDSKLSKIDHLLSSANYKLECENYSDDFFMQ